MNMKSLLTLAVLALAAAITNATDFPLATAFRTQADAILYATPLVSTNALNSSNTNGSAYYIEPNLYHTVQFNTTCTNSTSVILDRSLNSTHWVPFYTNTVTATGTNDTTFTGKWQAVRARFTGTNSTSTVLYLGGR